MLAEVQLRHPLETGGVLMGYVDGPGAVVVAATTPGLRAVHRDDGYIPDHDHDEVAVATVYAASRRRAQYLGDWHAHPTGAGTTSLRDRRTMAHIARAQDARCPRPLMLIVHGRKSERITAWTLHLGPGPFRRVAEVAVFDCDDEAVDSLA